MTTYGKFPALLSAYEPFMLLPSLSYRLSMWRPSSCARLRFAIHGGGGAKRTCSASSTCLTKACRPDLSRGRAAWYVFCDRRGEGWGEKCVLREKGATRDRCRQSPKLIDKKPCLQPCLQPSCRVACALAFHQVLLLWRRIQTRECKPQRIIRMRINICCHMLERMK